MSIKSERSKCLQKISDFLSKVNIPDAVNKVNDEAFMAEYVFPIANEQFIGDYWCYRSADHHLQNMDFYNDPANYEIHPIY